MRWALALLTTLVLPAQAAAHPGFVDIKRNNFHPQYLNVTTGSLVEWRWDGPDLNHTVTSDDGLFDSDPGHSGAQVLHSEGDSFAFFFDAPGTYAYHCKVHPNMTGRIFVDDAPAGDRRPPRLRRLRARVKGRDAVVRFKIDERASLLAEVRRPGRKRVLRDAFRFVRKGKRSLRVRVPRGRTVVRLQATDDAGNRSSARSVRVRR